MAKKNKETEIDQPQLDDVTSETEVTQETDIPEEKPEVPIPEPPLSMGTFTVVYIKDAGLPEGTQKQLPADLAAKMVELGYCKII